MCSCVANDEFGLTWVDGFSPTIRLVDKKTLPKPVYFYFYFLLVHCNIGEGTGGAVGHVGVGPHPPPPKHHGNSDYTEWAHSPCTQLASSGR